MTTIAIQMTSAIRKIAFPAFEEQGFIFDEQESSRNYWTFSRRTEELTQYISIKKSNHSSNSISLFLCTTKDRAGITGKHLADREESWWEYQDQAGMIAALSEIVQVAIEKGIPWFGYSATIVPPIPEAIGKELFTKHDQFVNEFCRENGIQLGQPESVGQLQVLIRKRKEETENLDWSFIAKVAAVFGEHVRQSFGGAWQWDERFSEPFVVGVGGRSEMYIHPLFHVVRYWCNPYNRLLAQYWYLENTLQYNFPFEERVEI